MRLLHDRDADAVYLAISDRRVAATTVLDDVRFVHFDGDGYVRGLEWLNVSAGVRLDGMPVDTDAVAALLQDHGLIVLGVPRLSWEGVSVVQSRTSGSLQASVTCTTETG